MVALMPTTGSATVSAIARVHRAWADYLMLDVEIPADPTPEEDAAFGARAVAAADEFLAAIGQLARCRAADHSELIGKVAAAEMMFQFEEVGIADDRDGARWRLLASLKADLAAMADGGAGDLAEAA